MFFTPHHGASGQEQEDIKALTVKLQLFVVSTKWLQLTGFYHESLCGDRLHDFNVGRCF